MVDTSSLPTNFNPNHAPTAAEMQTIIDLLTRCAAPPRASLQRNTDQSINTGTWTVISWNQQNKLRNMTWSSSSNPSRLTCAVAGAYRITCFVQWQTNATGTRTIAFSVNSGGSHIGMIRTPAASQPIGVGSTITLDMAVGDYIEAVVWQDSGGTRTLTANGFGDGDPGYLYAEWVGESGS